MESAVLGSGELLVQRKRRLAVQGSGGVAVWGREGLTCVLGLWAACVGGNRGYLSKGMEDWLCSVVLGCLCREFVEEWLAGCVWE